MNFEIQGLSALIKIAELGSFSAASQALHISQPAVSKRIKVLEDEIGAPLFDRIGRRMQLTEAGSALLPIAKRIMAEMDEASLVMNNLALHVTGTLNIACSHHIGIHRLPHVLRQYRQQHPDVKLALQFMSSEEAIAALKQRHIELAFITLPKQLSSELMATKLWRDELCFAASSEHPLATRKQVQLNELAYSDCILPEPNTTTFELVAQLFHDHKLPLTPTIPVNYIETIRTLVGNGLGWSVLPASMIRSPLIALPVSAAKPVRHLGYLAMRGRTMSNAAKRFIEVLHDHS